MLVVLFVAAALLVIAAPSAGAQSTSPLLHDRPYAAAAVRFPVGFPALVDHEWGFALGGFGGSLPDDAAYGVVPSPTPVDHDPVVFVHGNTVDAADWYPVRDAFIAAGWSPDDLWALSYNGVGSNSGSAGGTTNPRRDAAHTASGNDGVSRGTDHETFADNPADLADFLDAVLAFTGAPRFSIVGHSLGVTMVRRTLERRPDLARRTTAFVGIAGGNQGTSLCPPGSEGVLIACDEVAAGTPWLARLNADLDELATAEVMTVLDGTGVDDSAYAGTYRDSPRLHGLAPWAVDCAYGKGHNDLRLNSDQVLRYRTFVEAAERGAVDRSLDPTTGVPVACGSLALPALSTASAGPPPGVAPVAAVPESSAPGLGVAAAFGLAVLAATSRGRRGAARRRSSSSRSG